MSYHAGIGPDDRDVSCAHTLGAYDWKLLAKRAEGDVGAAQHAGGCTEGLGGAEVNAEQLALVQVCVPAGREVDVPDVSPLKAQVKRHVWHHICGSRTTSERITIQQVANVGAAVAVAAGVHGAPTLVHPRSPGACQAQVLCACTKGPEGYRAFSRDRHTAKNTAGQGVCGLQWQCAWARMHLAEWLNRASNSLHEG